MAQSHITSDETIAQGILQLSHELYCITQTGYPVLAKAVEKDHRLCQTHHMWSAMAIITGLANNHADDYYDARNIAACQVAAKIMTFLQSEAERQEKDGLKPGEVKIHFQNGTIQL